MKTPGTVCGCPLGQAARLARILAAVIVTGPVLALQPRPGALTPPAPKYEVDVTRDLWIPMRDGVRLAADLYRPKGVSGPLPVILMRTPYNKELWPLRDGRFFAGQGFAVVVEDFRGRFKSEGVYHFTRGHRTDGYDTFAWIKKQPWSSGKIGTYGCSYLGEVQLYQAPALPPGLTAMIPQASGLATGSAGGFFHNAQDFGSGMVGIDVLFDWWYKNGEQLFYAPRQPSSLDPGRAAAVSDLYRTGPQIPDVDYAKVFVTLPITAMMDAAVAPPSEFVEFVRRQQDLTDPWWKQFDYITDDTRINAPALFIESWNDLSAGAALYLRGLFERTAPSATARNNQFIIVSPGSHCTSERMTANEYIGDQFAGDPRFGHLDIYVKWFRYWLMNDQNAITEMPKVQYFVLGRNEWHAANQWPVPGTKFERYYLHSAGRANSHFGDGRLTLEPPAEEPVDGHVYDPFNPAPSSGANDYHGTKPIVDQLPLSAREDVLVYTSEPLLTGREMTGDIEAVLYVSSSARDTDFIAKLVDVYPDGRALNVREGALRARYRHGRDKPPELMSPGQIYPLRIRLGSYSLYFPQGHRIRLQITSSSFPRYERNLNSGGNNVDESSGIVAHNRVYHDAAHPSYVLLPMVTE
jgi:uncharacterized protein